MGIVPSPDPVDKPKAYEEAALEAAHTILVEHDFDASESEREDIAAILQAAKAAHAKLGGRGSLLHILCSAFDARDDYYDYVHPYSVRGHALMCFAQAICILHAQSHLETAANFAADGCEFNAPRDVGAAQRAFLRAADLSANPRAPLPTTGQQA
jgi:hypothetical protein